MLTSAYTFLFQKQRAEEINILSEAVSSKKKRKLLCFPDLHNSQTFLSYSCFKRYKRINRMQIIT